MDPHFDPGLFKPALTILAAAVAVGPFGPATLAGRLPLLRAITLADQRDWQ